MARREHKLTVLIADDDPQSFIEAKPFIEADLDVDVRTVARGEELLAYLHDQGEADGSRPSLIVLDVDMPLSEGREVLRMIRENPVLKAIPIIAITKSDADTEVQAAYELGANSYISKHCSLFELLDMFRSVHEYWLGAQPARSR